MDSSGLVRGAPQTGHPLVAAAVDAGARTAFTLSGAHIFPLYDAALRGEPTLRLIDVRHEASAVFAAEAVGKLTRTPGFAMLTAGPGVTNALSPITQAHFSGAPLVVLGGRAAQLSWGRGSLQELDQPPLFASVTKSAATITDPALARAALTGAFAVAGAAHRGPVFLDIPLDLVFHPEVPQSGGAESVAGAESLSGAGAESSRQPDPEAIAEIARLLRQARRPVLVLGSDVWADGAETAALGVAEQLDIPVITNGMGRGIVPRGHRLLATKARRLALGKADLVIVAGTPLDFRLGYGAFGPGGTARVVHLADTQEQVCRHRGLAGAAYGSLGVILAAIREASTPGSWREWTTRVAGEAAAGAARDAELMRAGGDRINPARVYGELAPRLADDAVVIGDGGDFVSWAGKLVEPARPGCWLDPGPFGCLGAGLGAAIGARTARPDSQIVLLLGDGAAGMSLMDLDTLVRHQLPAVIVVGNNSAWGLEKHPMRALYGYDALADLGERTAYDAIARALGGAGETVERPEHLGAALDRAFAAGVPYLVNVITDTDAAYPRSTSGI
ncbi:acetolactate synthase [Nostocoides jenkinsii]|uniref:Putative acetolactate synthase n=1 Tax=Nostocoides jenkinsii Ben 74 TaxID=1193518 RepID=A0A077MA82_9MICO|nr:acetolactate synthase [Tetrasphaera jenkinsii]CCI54276.1 putative acetolactate synthase [Tetrasphaera jenkinsii Ben 74]